MDLKMHRLGQKTPVMMQAKSRTLNLSEAGPTG
jgi:hypothetical protein